MTASRARPGPVTWAQILARGGGDVTAYVGKRPLAWHADPRAVRPDVLALDVAARSGWACLADGGCQCPPICGACDGAAHCLDHCRRRGIIRQCGHLVRTQDVSDEWVAEQDAVIASADTGGMLVLVESSSVGWAGRRPVPALSVERYVGAALALCARRGIPALRVVASQWQTAILGRHRREAGKALALAAAKRVMGAIEVASEDVADAVCLALWGRGGRP